MKVKLIAIVFILGYATNSMASFSQVENNQLNEINEKSKTQVSSDIKELNKSFDAKIENHPENKQILINLRKSWDNTIHIKCQFETLESKGTDAEVSAVNTCLSKEYQQEIKYLNELLP